MSLRLARVALFFVILLTSAPLRAATRPQGVGVRLEYERARFDRERYAVPAHAKGSSHASHDRRRVAAREDGGEPRLEPGGRLTRGSKAWIETLAWRRTRPTASG